MKIISIGFKNPFHESGYTNTIKINGLNDINVFIGKNNSGKTNVLRSIFNLLHQDIERSEIFGRIKVKLDNKDFQSIIEGFHKVILKMFNNRNKADFETVPIARFFDGEFVNQFYPLFNLIKDFPISKKCLFTFNLDNDLPNKKLLFDYIIENNDDLNEQVHKQIEYILKKVKSDQDLIKIIIKQILAFRKVILIPSFRTLEISEKKYQDREIREITSSIRLILDSNFDKIPNNAQRVEPFKIPNLALMLSIIKDKQMTGEYKEIMNPEFFDYFNSSLRKIFPDINLSIDFKLTELTTNGGYKEYGKNMGDWTKLGHGTQQLISLLFLLILPRDCVYIIDEPDISLHPGLQLKLLRFIKNIILADKSYSKQFFFATHSTSFIDFKGKCSHFICEKTKDDFSIKLLEEDNINIIRDVLGLNPGTLLQANGIIWVEGPSDSFYIKMLFKCFGMDLEDSGVLIATYGGIGNIINDFFSLELLKKINPHFCIIIDSEKEDENDVISVDLKNKKEEFEKKKKFFWILEKLRNIEGIISQNVINEYFDIRVQLTTERLKRPFEKLGTYIKRLKELDIIPKDRKKYLKYRDAPKLSKLILSNPKYVRGIRQNNYIEKNVQEIIDRIDVWNNRIPSSRIIKNHPIDDWSGISIIPPSESRKIFGNTKKIIPENDIDDYELFQISKFESKFTIMQSKMQLIDFLTKYENLGKVIEDQRKILSYFNYILEKNKTNLEKLGFVYIRNRDTIQDENYAINLKKNEKNEFNRFLIRRLKDGKIMEKDKVYYSTSFSIKHIALSEITVLKDFIDYLKYNKVYT